MDGTAVKTCSKCKAVKSTEDFTRNITTKDGLSYQCWECKRAYTVKYRASEKGRAQKEAFAHELLLRWLAAKS